MGLSSFKSTEEQSDESRQQDYDEIDKVRQRLFLVQFNDGGEFMGPDPDGRDIPGDWDRRWEDATSEIKTGTIGQSDLSVHFCFCGCGEKVVFWLRRSWSRCKECSTVLINREWSEEWWNEEDSSTSDNGEDGDERGLSEWL